MLELLLNCFLIKFEGVEGAVDVQTRFVEEAKLLNSKCESAARHVQEHMVCCNCLSTASQRLTRELGVDKRF